MCPAESSFLLPFLQLPMLELIDYPEGFSTANKEQRTGPAAN